MVSSRAPPRFRNRTPCAANADLSISIHVYKAHTKQCVILYQVKDNTVNVIVFSTKHKTTPN